MNILKPYLIFEPDNATCFLSLLKNVMTQDNGLSVTPLISTCLQEIANQVLQHAEIDISNLPATTADDFKQLADIESVDKMLRIATICFMIQAKRDEHGKAVKQELDKTNFEILKSYADSVSYDALYLTRLANLIYDDVMQALNDMKLDSISLQHHSPIEKINELEREVFPYRDNPNPELAARYENLQSLPENTVGHHFWAHFKKNKYHFPGDKHGFIEHFATLHDTAHLLSGYDTSFIGEVYGLAFNEAMHPESAMWQFHPFFMTWQSAYPAYDENMLRTDIVGVSELCCFWEAWQRGYNCSRDHFADQKNWDFWQYAEMPLQAYRELHNVPPVAAGEFKGYKALC